MISTFDAVSFLVFCFYLSHPIASQSTHFPPSTLHSYCLYKYIHAARNLEHSLHCFTRADRADRYHTNQECHHHAPPNTVAHNSNRHVQSVHESPQQPDDGWGKLWRSDGQSEFVGRANILWRLEFGGNHHYVSSTMAWYVVLREKKSWETTKDPGSGSRPERHLTRAFHAPSKVTSSGKCALQQILQ